MSELNLYAGGGKNNPDPQGEEATLTIKLTSVGPGQLGPIMDELVPLLRDVTAVLDQDGVKTEVDIPGWNEIWLGWEREDR